MGDNELTTLSRSELEERLLEATDTEELDKIVSMFNIAAKKKDIIRNNKLIDAQDKISEQMLQRIEHRAGEFSNKDLLDYFKVIQETISKADSNNLDSIKPAIQINQQNININEDTLTRESRDRITSAINSILAKAQVADDSISVDFDIIEEDREEQDTDGSIGYFED